MWKKEYQASYTVEASYLMPMVILILSLLIRTAYDRCYETTAEFRLHHAIYQLRGQEEDKNKILGIGAWKGNVNRDENQILGTIHCENENMQIKMRSPVPEKTLRKQSVLKDFYNDLKEDTDGQSGADGGQLSSGDEK